jgi:hypothetical protein
MSTPWSVGWQSGLSENKKQLTRAQFSTGKVLDFYPRDYAFPSVDFSAVKWARYVFPTGILSDRDFVFVEHAGECQRNGRKVGYGVAGSLERPEWGPLQDVVRAEIFMSGYVFRELDPDGDKNLLELTYWACARVEGVCLFVCLFVDRGTR